MKDKEKDQWKTSNYDAYIHAEMDDAALFLYAELREILLGGIVADAEYGLDRILDSEGYCERRQTAWDVGICLKAVKKLVMVLLNKAVWLDDETERSSAGKRERAAARREFEATMAKLAETCREIADLVEEAVS